MEKENLLEKGIKWVEKLEKRRLLNAEKMDTDLKRLVNYVSTHSLFTLSIDIMLKLSIVWVLYIIFKI